MEYYDPSSVNLIFKEIIEELSTPLLTFENFSHTFNFIKNDLKLLYESNDDIKNAIGYFDNMIQELNANESASDKIYGLTLIVDKYLCVTTTNKDFIESSYAIVQYIMQACFNQILQQLFRVIHKKNMEFDDIENALNLFKDTFKDIISSAKSYKMTEKIIEL